MLLPRRRIEREGDGSIALRLPRQERELLRSLPAELRSLLDEAPEDPSLRRLFPPAYEDAEDEDEYRRLMRDELADGHRRALEVVEKTADRERLDEQSAESWLRALEDLRLVLGTRLDVQEETLLEEIGPSHPRAHDYALYAYLSWLQEQLVEALGS